MRLCIRRSLTAVVLLGSLVPVVAVSPSAARSRATLAPGTVTTITPGVSADATAALTNMVMTDAVAPGFLSLDACPSMAAGPQSRSAANYAPGAVVANLTMTPVSGGQFCAYNLSALNLVADVEGYVAPASAGGLSFVPTAPTRLLDTRRSPGHAAGGGTVTTVHTGLPSGAAAAMVNIAVVDPAGPGFVTADRCDAFASVPPDTSDLNYLGGQVVSNVSIVPVDAAGDFCVYASRATDVVVDLQGALTPDVGLGLTVQSAVRVLDTRTSSVAPIDGGTVSVVDSGAPPGATAVVVNLAMTAAAAPGYIVAGRCAAIGSDTSTSNGNYLPGDTVSNLSIVEVDDAGRFCIYNHSAVHLVVDVEGWFGAAASGELYLIPPARVLDTRPATPTATSCTSVIHIGDSTSVGLISPSYLPNPADRVDAQYRRVGVETPIMEISGARSIVERLSGQRNAAEVAAEWKAQGYEGCWVLALGTTDTANVAAGSNVSRRARIDQMMSIVGDDQVMWVNVRSLVASGPWSNTAMQQWNAELAAAATRYPNLHVYDWSSVVQPSWFSGDGIHYTTDGCRLRAQLIADALMATEPS